MYLVFFLLVINVFNFLYNLGILIFVESVIFNKKIL
jgi:hypothetical protein